MSAKVGSVRGGKGRLLLLAIAVVGATLLLWRRTTGPPAIGPVWSRILSTHEMRICVDPSFPPFESSDPSTGELVGFDVDLGKEIARRLGVKVSFVPVGFDGLYDALTSNTCELVLSAFPYDPRQTEDFIFSVAYFNAGQVLVVPRSTDPPGALTDLKGRAVAVEWGSDGDIALRRWNRRVALTPYPAETPDAALQAVLDGQAQAAVVDAVSAYAFIRQNPTLSVTATITEDNYVAVMRPDAYTFVGYINEILMQMREEGFLTELRKRWF
jgi:ABC-type amino acid transport substrate-binding protein